MIALILLSLTSVLQSIANSAEPPPIVVEASRILTEALNRDDLDADLEKLAWDLTASQIEELELTLLLAKNLVRQVSRQPREGATYAERRRHRSIALAILYSKTPLNDEVMATLAPVASALYRDIPADKVIRRWLTSGPPTPAGDMIVAAALGTKRRAVVVVALEFLRSRRVGLDALRPYLGEPYVIESILSIDPSLLHGLFTNSGESGAFVKQLDAFDPIKNPRLLNEVLARGRAEEREYVLARVRRSGPSARGGVRDEIVTILRDQLEHCELRSVADVVRVDSLVRTLVALGWSDEAWFGRMAVRINELSRTASDPDDREYVFQVRSMLMNHLVTRPAALPDDVVTGVAGFLSHYNLDDLALRLAIFGPRTDVKAARERLIFHLEVQAHAQKARTSARYTEDELRSIVGHLAAVDSFDDVERPRVREALTDTRFRRFVVQDYPRLIARTTRALDEALIDEIASVVAGPPRTADSLVNIRSEFNSRMMLKEAFAPLADAARAGDPSDPPEVASLVDQSTTETDSFREQEIVTAANEARDVLRDALRAEATDPAAKVVSLSHHPRGVGSGPSEGSIIGINAGAPHVARIAEAFGPSLLALVEDPAAPPELRRRAAAIMKAIAVHCQHQLEGHAEQTS